MDHANSDNGVVDLVQDPIAADAKSEKASATPRERPRRTWVGRECIDLIEHGCESRRVVGHEGLCSSERLVRPDDVVGQRLVLPAAVGGSPRAALASDWET